MAGKRQNVFFTKAEKASGEEAAYQERIAPLISSAADAIEMFGEDELERYAAEQERKQRQATK